MNPEDPFDMFKWLGADLAKILHGEQSFEYFEPICAGDCVRVRRKVVDAYQKKSAALTFFVIQLTYEDARSFEVHCAARQTLIVRSEAVCNAE
jgi:hypothetical protein